MAGVKVNKKKKSEFARASLGDKIFIIMVIALVLLVTFVCIYPLWFTLAASFSDPYAVYGGKVKLWPVNFTLEGYKLIIENQDIWRGYANAIFYTIFGTMFNLFLTIPTAYVLSKKKLYGRGFISTLFIIAMYFNGGMIPNYILMNNLHLVNTKWILIVVNGISIYNVIITRTYFQNSIPETLYEAAKIDGADEFKNFFKIALPLSKPIIAVITLYYAVAHWSDYFNAMIYVTNSKLQPLQVVLQQILIYNKTAYNTLAQEATDGALIMDLARRSYLSTVIKYAIVFVASAPMLIIYPFIQKHFVKGIMIGSLKE